MRSFNFLVHPFVFAATLTPRIMIRFAKVSVVLKGRRFGNPLDPILGGGRTNNRGDDEVRHARVHSAAQIRKVVRGSIPTPQVLYFVSLIDVGPCMTGLPNYGEVIAIAITFTKPTSVDDGNIQFPPNVQARGLVIEEGRTAIYHPLTQRDNVIKMIGNYPLRGLTEHNRNQDGHQLGSRGYHAMARKPLV